MTMQEDNGGLTEQAANDIYDVLVEHAGASPRPDDRFGFISVQTHGYCSEYRFMGSLGFGGKFRRERGDHIGRRDSWCVTAYPEDSTPERRDTIVRTNIALLQLQAGKGT